MLECILKFRWLIFTLLISQLLGVMLLKLCSKAQAGGRPPQSRGLRSWLSLLPTLILFFSIVLLALLLLAFLPKTKLSFDKQHGKEENINFPEAFQDSAPWRMEHAGARWRSWHKIPKLTVSQTLTAPSPLNRNAPPFFITMLVKLVMESFIEIELWENIE